MGGLIRYLVLKAQVHAGLSTAIVVWAALAVLAALIAAAFFLTAAYIFLAERYGAVKAGLAFGALFVVLAAIGALVAVLVRRSAMREAERELAERKSAAGGLLDPRMMAMGFQIGRSLGWRKLASLGAVAVLAAGLANEWIGQGKTRAPDDEQNK